MLVELWEKAESVFSRQIPASPYSRSRHGHAARLPSGNASRLQYRNVESALHELLRGTHAGDPAALKRQFFPLVNPAVHPAINCIIFERAPFPSAIPPISNPLLPES